MYCTTFSPAMEFVPLNTSERSTANRFNLGKRLPKGPLLYLEVQKEHLPIGVGR